MGIVDNYDKIPQHELEELEELGFDWDEDLECFTSYQFGSC